MSFFTDMCGPLPLRTILCWITLSIVPHVMPSQFSSDLIVLAGVGASQAMDYVNYQIRSMKVKKAHSKELSPAHTNAHSHVPAMLSWNLGGE